jgi:uncharacterized protein (TIGR03084 family)
LDEIVAALAGQQAELSGLVAGIDEDRWQRPSRCEGWTVADVVLHVAQSNELAIASVEGRFPEFVTEQARAWGGDGDGGTVDDVAAVMVERERGGPGSAVLERWERGAATLCRLFEEHDLHARVQWVAGELSARTLATTRLAETWIHTGDVAAAFDVAPAPTDRLRPIARLAWRTLPYAFARDGRELTGPVAFSLRGPAGEHWDFVPDEEPLTTISGDALELCLLAARRVEPADTGLQGQGPDASAVLDLVRTYA